MSNSAFRFVFLIFVMFSTSVLSFAQTCTPVSTAAGSLDTCFGKGGKVTTKLSAGIDAARGVAVQADGKIIVVGGANESSGPNSASNFGIVRYNPDGSLDVSFDGDGKTTTDFEGRMDKATSVQIQSDGKIVVAGLSTNYFAVARYNIDGSLDTTFDGDGKVLTDVGAPSSIIYNSMAIQTDGKLVVAGGGAGSGFPASFLNVVRYNADGSVDLSFDGDGRAIVGGIAYGNGVVIQPDGKILTAGSAESKLKVARLNPDGSPDTAFGTNGIATFGKTGLFHEAFTLTTLPNGKIIAAGASRQTQNGQPCGLLVGFDTNGAFESNFYTCSGSSGNAVNGLLIQPDGKILTAGFNNENIWKGFQITRLNNLGSYDTGFNGSGILNIGFIDGNTNNLSTAYALAMQRDKKIVAVGSMQNFDAANNGSFAVVRIMSGIAAPRAAPFDFDGDGKSDVSVFRPSTNVWYAFQSSNNNVSARVFGAAGDVPAPADYDGDGKTDLGVFRPSSGDWWYLSGDSGTGGTVRWGQSGDIPVLSDFDGDDKADFVVYRPSENVWYRAGSSGAVSITAFGAAGDKPLSGDFDGDGKSDPAIFRPSTGDWWWKSGVDGSVRVTHWGISTDTPVPADYDGDGKTDFAVYRGGVWYILQSGNGRASIVNFGLAADEPVAADYDGDGRSDIAVFRPSEGIWYLNQTTAGFAAMQFGVSTDTALPNVAVP